MRKLISTLATAGLLAGLVTYAHAHIGDKVYLVFEILDDDLVDIDLNDQSIEDWQDVVGPASLKAPDFFPDPSVGEGANYDPADLDYQIWLGWNRTGNHLYAAVERLDNVYMIEQPPTKVGGIEGRTESPYTG
jgi:hypothetical protein